MCSRSLVLKSGLAHTHKFVITWIVQTKWLCALCVCAIEKQNIAVLLRCYREHNGQKATDWELVTPESGQKRTHNWDFMAQIFTAPQSHKCASSWKSALGKRRTGERGGKILNSPICKASVPLHREWWMWKKLTDSRPWDRNDLCWARLTSLLLADQYVLKQRMSKDSWLWPVSDRLICSP